MKNILFVDDERKVLDGIRRTLRPMRHEWNICFLESGMDALQALQQESFDVVISDIRMPNMNGVELLTTIKSQYPHIVRIALSGYADSELMAECTKAAHQFLSKPCDIETIKATIARACTLKDSLGDHQLISFISTLDCLPSLPSLYAEIMDEITAPDGRIRKVAAIIGKDVSMTAKILQLVNSSFYGFSKNVSTINQAVTILGFDVIRSLVLSAKIFQYFDDRRNEKLNLEPLWQHSAQTGAIALKVAKLAGANGKTCDVAQMAGMLHDVGILILQKNKTEEYREVELMCESGSLPRWRAEKSIIGYSHMQVGAYLLALWGIQNSIVEAVAYHHCPSKASPEAEFSPLAAVHIAQHFAREGAQQGCPAQASLDQDFLTRIGVLDRISTWSGRCVVNKNNHHSLV